MPPAEVRRQPRARTAVRRPVWAKRTARRYAPREGGREGGKERKSFGPTVPPPGDVNNCKTKGIRTNDKGREGGPRTIAKVMCLHAVECLEQGLVVVLELHAFSHVGADDANQGEGGAGGGIGGG